jgi:hypothetical protein
MINAIGLLRATADKCECKARNAKNPDIKTELFDMTAEWYGLVRKAANLNDRTNQIETA